MSTVQASLTLIIVRKSLMWELQTTQSPLRYYYQGCASWNWYFPFHYAPFASDFRNIAALFKDFPLDTRPFNPMEQLMGVFPAGNCHFAHLILTKISNNFN